ncbi:HNH endonuclease signature motif containing protein [uncultured Idiomarina sp.]|uniref:HNH endonuclease n=1 Tax=uncultured Idiomarina sp. TaxID=352961 RepID=UPI0032B17C13|tara:strand:- start:9545 stop:10117 length:573 start_codon:yes stop_codon:yes gene_type:complete
MNSENKKLNRPKKPRTLPTKRKTPPTKRQILTYWTSTKEGQEHILRLRKAYRIKIENVVLLDYDCYSCFACNRQTSSLERCHIKPHANGGENIVSNFVLMCSDCHEKSPTIDSEKIFWKWLNKVEDNSFWGNRIRAIKSAIPKNHKGKLPSKKQVTEALTKYDVPTIGGRVSASTVEGVLTELFESESID